MEREKAFALRLAQLRMQAGISARDMSLSLGQSESYINKIENGKSLPSMQVFFYICDYFGISPQEFFDAENRNPTAAGALADDIKTLTDSQIASIADIVKGLKR